MPQEYVPKSVKETGKTDLHGNMGYSVLFSNGENAFQLAKKAPEVGVPEYGEIVDAPKKSGDGTYKKFVRMMKEEYAPTSGSQAPQYPPSNITARVEELEKRVAKIEQRYADTTSASSVDQTSSQSPSGASQIASDFIADEIDLDGIPF